MHAYHYADEKAMKKLAIFTHVLHTPINGNLYAYAPYVREMDLWNDNFDEIVLVAPIDSNRPLSPILKAYKHQNIKLMPIPAFNVLSFAGVLRTLFYIPKIVFTMVNAMRTANHLHLRCPGNVGLLACALQVFFPKKRKTAKYAGNWDPQSKQPFSYKLQQKILRNELLTKNMSVLVYGDWQEKSKNIVPFFTASYSNDECTELPVKQFKPPFNFLFVANLAPGKNVQYSVKLIEKLVESGWPCKFTILGDGQERQLLEEYLANPKTFYISFLGNQDKETVKKYYQNSHFLILPSNSEGWPKVVAEAMFWGSIPVVSKVSCVPWMLGFGERGFLLETELGKDAEMLQKVLKDANSLPEISKSAMQWSRQFTTNKFASEIKKLL